jgi:hypothetical protein
MCIAVIKPRGVDLPTQTELASCFESNKDGFGMAYTEEGQEGVTIRKGALTLPNVYALLDSVEKPKERNMILHFRIATEGAVCAGNCHPFPLSGKGASLQSTSIRTSMAIAHNGVINVTNEDKIERNTTIPAGASLTWESGKQGYRERGGKFVPYKWTTEDWAGHYNTDGGFYSYVYRSGLNLRYSDTQVFIRDYLYPIKDNLLDKGILNILAWSLPGKFVFLTAEKFYYMGDFKEEGGRLYSNESYKAKTCPVTYASHACTKEHTKPTIIVPDSKLTGLFWKCGLCEKYVPKQTTHDYEDMTLCDDCFTAQKEMAEDKTKISTLPAYEVGMGY